MPQQDEFRLQIPRPCHENWAQMTPAEQGRHCDVCKKVVRDFENSSIEEIAAAVAQAPAGQVCGRVRQTHLAPKELPAQAYYRFPVDRMRHFLLAFVASFGWSVWGISELDAQDPKMPDKISFSDSAHSAYENRVIEGRVLDTYSLSPIEQVRISVSRGAETGGGAYTDAEGNFKFELSAGFLAGGSYELHIHYMGYERREFEVPNDIRQIAITVDLSSIMPTITIEQKSYSGRLTGVITMGAVVTQTHVRGMDPHSRAGTTLYRPLDEWLMMNFSEINHSGRH